MNLHNEYSLEPGTYQYNAEIIVVTDIVTHDDLSNQLPDSMVVYRPVLPLAKHHVRFMVLSKWRELVTKGTIKKI